MGESRLTLTQLYVVTWCISLLIPILDEVAFGEPGRGGLDVRPSVELDWYITMPFIAFTLLANSFDMVNGERLCVIAHILDLSVRLSRMPNVWDHEQWTMLIELTFVFTRLLDLPESVFRLTCQRQLGLLYAAATFWKVNPSFLNPETSCGTVVILEFVAAYLPFLPFAWVHWLGSVAATATLIVEGLIASLMFVYSELGMCRELLLAHTCLFHLVIFVMPVNAAGGFSMDCLKMLVVFFSTDDVETCFNSIFRKKRTALELCQLFATSVVVPIALLVQMRFVSTTQALDFNYVGFCALLVLYAAITVTKRRRVASPTKKTPLKSKRQFSLASSFLVALAFAHAFVFTILGVEQMGAPTMFSNLNYYGGGNHYVVPIGILGDDLLHGGGLVQIHSSTSHLLNERVGYFRSDVLWSQRAISYIKMQESATSDMKHPIQYFSLLLINEPSRGILLDSYTESNPSGSVNFVPFILPISAVNQVIRSAIQAGEVFEVHVSRVADKDGGDALADGAVSVLRSHGSCAGPNAQMENTSACVDGNVTGDPLLQTLLDGSLRRGFVHNLIDSILIPYPHLLDGRAEETCMT